MTHYDIEQALLAHPNSVWTVLMKNGLEFISRIEHRPVKVLTFVRPFCIRTVNIPMQNGGSIHVQTTPQLQPFTWWLDAKELPLFHEDVWFMTEAPKKIEDAYVQATTGILTGVSS